MIREHLPCLSGALRVVCGDVAFVLVRTRQEMQMGCHSPSLLLFQTYVIIHSYSGGSISFVLTIVLLVGNAYECASFSLCWVLFSRAMEPHTSPATCCWRCKAADEASMLVSSQWRLVWWLSATCRRAQVSTATGYMYQGLMLLFFLKKNQGLMSGFGPRFCTLTCRLAPVE